MQHLEHINLDKILVCAPSILSIYLLYWFCRYHTTNGAYNVVNLMFRWFWKKYFYTISSLTPSNMAKMALVGLFESFESPMRSVLTPLYYFQLNFVYVILPGTIWKHSSFPNVCHPFSLPPPTSPNRSCVTGSLLLSVRYPSSALRVWSFLSQLHLRLSGHVPGYKRYSHTPLSTKNINS